MKAMAVNEIYVNIIEVVSRFEIYEILKEVVVAFIDKLERSKMTYH